MCSRAREPHAPICGYSLVRTPDKRRPGHIPGKNPGPSACSRGIKTRSPCPYARNSRRCPVLRAGCMRASEETYRLYSCRRCAQQVRICGRCDRGQQYCTGECAQIRRRESLRRAARRYQQSYRGACRHAVRQRAWRARRTQKVTHQGSFGGVTAPIVASSATTTEETYADGVGATALPHCDRTRPRCCFCGRPLGHFARLAPLRGGR